MRNSLRWRLAWSFALLSTLAVLIQAIALFMTTEEQEEDMIDEVVNVTLDDILTRSGGTMPGLSQQSLTQRLSLYHLRPGESPAPLPREYGSKPVGNYEWYSSSTEYHIGIREVGGERFYLLYDVGEHEVRLERLRWNLVTGIFVLGLVSLWLGYWLAGRLLYQLQKMTDHLQRDDRAQLYESGLDREVGLLARALDDYRQRNRELLSREREFTANVSHELRTPLTRVRTSAELLLEEPALAERARTRLERIVTAADDMEARLRGLLFLARETALATLQRLDLRQRVQASAGQFAPACTAAGVGLDVLVPPETMIEADASLLALLLDNLIGNAARYTREGKITIDFADGALTVCDTGPGIAPEHLAHVFDRHYRASDIPGGMGLGLSIVERICAAHGWHCSIDSVAEPGDPRQGTRVTVRFAPAAPI
ncbi:HAMP domain-containing sensor histidine kinase [Janthinobacterium sp. 17J80-10]|uniref:sensor histidine kinase n=1 Tax=Janthinobacterium sp. 17J80-10 TaxID=2497863 RepID=UPI001005A206|nr:HAMP domain-containing sensor histidine kinase [Janthinobacterium sp. 17J80-10]QAU33133.1 HAMP domain-containing histidine kinase [Janthinobacterium sp. 17J80-10]